MGYSRQEYWSGLPFSPPGDLLDPGIEPTFSVSPAVAGRFFTTEPHLITILSQLSSSVFSYLSAFTHTICSLTLEL